MVNGRLGGSGGRSQEENRVFKAHAAIEIFLHPDRDLVEGELPLFGFRLEGFSILVDLINIPQPFATSSNNSAISLATTGGIFLICVKITRLKCSIFRNGKPGVWGLGVFIHFPGNDLLGVSYFKVV